MSVTIREVLINGRWPLRLPDHRAARPEWITGWEVARLDAMHKAIRPGDVIYDCGAEEGDMSALLAQWTGPTGQIHLFEPNKRVWPNIKTIFEANGLGPPAGWVVGFASDEPSMHWASESGVWSYCWRQGPVNPEMGVPWDKTRQTRLADCWPPCADGPVIGDHGFLNLYENDRKDGGFEVTLDAYTGCHDPPDIITIDVEGAEFRILLGAIGTLRHHKPVVFVSVHPETMALCYGKYQNELNWLVCGPDSPGYQADFLGHDHEQHWVFQHPDNMRLKITHTVEPI